MAEVTAFRNNALPYPVYGTPYVVSFPLLDADGDPVSPSSPDSEISKNGDTFTDCTNEATEIATSSGICYLSLTGTELTTDCATIRIQSTGAKTTVLSLYPRKLVSIRAGTSASAGSSTSTIVLDGSASAVDDFYNGMIVVAVIDSVTEVRMITDYTGSTQTATVTPDWNTAPDNNDTFTVYRPDGVQIQQANVTHVNSTSQTAGDLAALTAASAIRSAVGLASANLDTQIGDLPTNAELATSQAAADDATLSAISDVATAVSNNGTAINAVATAVADIPTNAELTTALAAIPGLVLASGTIGSTGNTTTALHLAGLAYGDDEINNHALVVVDVSTGLKYTTWIEDFANAGDLATVQLLPFTPQASTDTYILLSVRKDVTTGSGLDAAGVRAAVGLASANLDTQLDAIPTNSDLSTALGTADDAVLAAIATLQTYVDTEVAAIKAKTDNLPTDPADASDIASSFSTVNSTLSTIASYIDTEVAAIKAKTDNLPAAPAAMGDCITAAGVRTAVGLASANLDTQLSTIDDFLDTEIAAIKTVTDQLVAAQTEPSSVPAANATPLAKLAWLAMLARNKILQTATAQTLKADDGTTTVGTATVSDDGTTFQRSEWS